MPPGAGVLILPADPKPRDGDAAVHRVNVHALRREQGRIGKGGYLTRSCCPKERSFCARRDDLGEPVSAEAHLAGGRRSNRT